MINRFKKSRLLCSRKIGYLFPLKNRVGAWLNYLFCLTYNNMFPCSRQNEALYENSIYEVLEMASYLLWQVAHVLGFCGNVGTKSRKFFLNQRDKNVSTVNFDGYLFPVWRVQ